MKNLDFFLKFFFIIQIFPEKTGESALVRQKKLIEASRNGNYELVKQLLNTTYVDTVDEFGSTPLIETGKFSSKYFFSFYKFLKSFS